MRENNFRSARLVVAFALFGIFPWGLGFSGAAFANDVLAGHDIFQTDPCCTFQDFGLAPIPADFFYPGSDPFAGFIQLEGNPPGSQPECPNDNVPGADTIVKRNADAILPVIPSSDTIPIEIVALALRSISPITVTGTNPDELWDIEVDLSGVLPQPLGTMTIRHENPQGGTFDSVLPVIPRFAFTRQSDSELRVLDLGDLGQVIELEAGNVPWVHSVPPDGSCTSNFCVNPDGLTVEESLLAEHGVISICPQAPVPADPFTWGQVKALYR